MKFVWKWLEKNWFQFSIIILFLILVLGGLNYLYYIKSENATRAQQLQACLDNANTKHNTMFQTYCDSDPGSMKEAGGGGITCSSLYPIQEQRLEASLESDRNSCFQQFK
jgi:hypothetical protein